MIDLDSPITKHFLWREVVFSETAARQGIDNSVPEELVANVMRQAQLMENIRYVLGGRPINITSWYRCPKLNAAIGGSSDHSAHMKGLACDFHCSSLGSPLVVARYLAQSTEIHFDQLIHEFGVWVHIGLGDGNRMQLLTSKRVGGKTVWETGLNEVSDT